MSKSDSGTKLTEDVPDVGSILRDVLPVRGPEDIIRILKTVLISLSSDSPDPVITNMAISDISRFPQNRDDQSRKLRRS